MRVRFNFTLICPLAVLAMSFGMAAQQTSAQNFHTGHAALDRGGVQADCLQAFVGRPGLPLRHQQLPPVVEEHFCKLVYSRTQTPQVSGELAKNDQSSSSFTIFDPPGSTSTNPSAITANGTIIGNYTDASGVQHGFVRTPAGTFANIDVPGATSTTPTDITPGGVITGWYCSATCYPFPSPIGGFLRAPDGTFTTFTPPPGGFIVGSTYIYGGPPPSINPTGDIAGTYIDPSLAEHGFLRTQDGAFSTIDVPGATDFTEVTAINPAGAIIGDFCNPSTCYHGFLRTPDGTFDEINANAGIPTGINPAGAITGFGPDASAYLRSPDGTFTLFSPPGSVYTSPFAINPGGTITGLYCDDLGCHGFLRAQDGTITSFDPPGSTITFPTAINPVGVVTGFFYDASGVGHGFVYQP
jgi:hypothetical protein